MNVNIDACSICQLKCPKCPATTMGYTPNVGNGYLKLRDFKKLLDINPQIDKIELENIGEMFLNPELMAIIEYAYRKNIKVTSHSGANLNYAPAEILEGLVKYRFQHLVCSIDGATDKTYKMYRIGGSLDTVMGNIRIINHFKKIYHCDFPKLIWQFIVFGHNEHEIPMARKMAYDLNMGFFCKISWDPDYSPVRDKNFVMAQTGWPAVNRQEYENITGINYMRTVCYALWHNPRINWDGKISGCCWNIWSEFGGNAFKEKYISVINSERINYARQMLLGKAESRGDIPCSICNIYQKIRSSGRYLTMIEIFPPLWYRICRFIYRTYRLKLQKINQKNLR